MYKNTRGEAAVTENEAIEYLNRFSYKENMKLTFSRVGDADAIMIHSSYQVPDSRKEHIKPIFVTKEQMICSLTIRQIGFAQGFLYNQLRHHLLEHEKHEMYEWLRFDGNLIEDPHCLRPFTDTLKILETKAP
jgi:hypothetical protein